MTNYYIIAKANGYDWHTANNTINYRAHIGQTVAPLNPNTPPHTLNSCWRGFLHAGPTAIAAWHWNENHAFNECSFYVVQGTPVVIMGDDRGGKYEFLALYVVEELSEAEFRALLPHRMFSGGWLDQP